MSSITRKIRQQLYELGFRPDVRREIEAMGVKLTICQFIMVVLSIMSVLLLVVPFIYLKQPFFYILFFALSILSLGVGIWFWKKQADICEHPEEVEG